MKFTHTADWHIGCLVNHFGVDRALERTKKAINSIIKKTVANECDYLFVAGDIFHRANITRDEISLFWDILLKLEKAPFKTFFISGNHDKITPELTTLHNFKKVCDAGLLKKSKFIIDTSEVIELNNEKVLFIPFEKTIETFNNLPNDISIIVSHYPVIGSKLSNGSSIDKGLSFKSIPCSYVAFGDIHQAQRIAKNAYYSGVPYQTNSGENKDCYINIVEVENNKLNSVEKEQVASYWPIIHLKAYNDEDLKNIPDDSFVILHPMNPLDLSKLPFNVKVQTTNFISSVEDKDENRKVDLDDLFVNPLSGMKSQIESECMDMVIKAGIEFTDEEKDSFFDSVVKEAEDIILKVG